MRYLKLILITLLSVVLLIVVLQNTEPVETRLLVATVTMPRAALLAITGGIGFVLGLLVALWLSRPGHKPKPTARGETGRSSPPLP